jgi:uncharacterized protein
MIPRIASSHLKQLANYYPVVVVTGPRQSGKTTLVKSEFQNLPYFNLEAPNVRARIEADPIGFLESYADGVIIDEFQRLPELASYIQVAADTSKKNGRFILTGSQQFQIMSKVSQSLAGRVGLLKLLPLSIEELKQDSSTQTLDHVLHKGFYPRLFDQNIPPQQAYSDYFATYVQRDVRALVNIVDLSQFEKFVRLCAGRIGQVLNLQNLCQDMGITHTTAQRWLSVLQASYIVHLTQPFYWRTTKRLIKSPKLFFYDVGLAAWLNGLQSPQQITNHPLRGNLFENMVMMEALKFRLNRGLHDNLFFYRDSDGSEVDLVLEFPNGIYPIEIKSGATVNSDYFKGLKHLGKFFKPASGELPNGGGLIYGGSDYWRQSGTQIVGYRATGDLLKACFADI